MNRLTSAFALIGASCLSTSLALAQGQLATLEELSGDVLVNQGQAFSPASQGMGLDRGDLLLTQTSSEALLTFADECKVRIPEDLRVNVTDAASCCINDEEDGEVVSADRIARVQSLDGVANIVRADEFSPAEVDRQLAVNDQIITGPDSGAVIEYALGCEVRLGPNEVLTVRFAEECCLGAYLIEDATALGAGGVVTPSSEAAAALLIGGAILGGALLDDDDNDGPPISGQ